VSSLATVSLFAGAFTFGTLLNLPNDGGAFDPQQLPCITTLLSLAFVLFSTSLFLTVALQIILRREPLQAILYGRKRSLVAIHFLLISGLIMGGFIVLNGVLIVSGQRAAGTVGIVCLVLCAIWIIVYWVLEKYWGCFPTARDVKSKEGIVEGMDVETQIRESLDYEGKNGLKQRTTL